MSETPDITASAIPEIRTQQMPNPAPQRMQLRPGPGGEAPSPKAPTIGVDLFVEDTPATETRPRTLYDAAWPITWTNVPAVLEDVSKQLTAWGIVGPKAVVLRFDARSTSREVVAMLMDYVVLNVRNAGLEAVIQVPDKNAPAERLPDSVAGV